MSGIKLRPIGTTIEEHILEEAATISLNTGEKFIVLSQLPSAAGQELRPIAFNLQKRGFGQTLEIGGQEPWDYHFQVSSNGFQHANEVRKARFARTLKGRLENLNWNAVNAVAASIAAVAALLAAYFSYITFVTQNA